MKTSPPPPSPVAVFPATKYAPPPAGFAAPQQSAARPPIRVVATLPTQPRAPQSPPPVATTASPQLPPPIAAAPLPPAPQPPPARDATSTPPPPQPSPQPEPSRTSPKVPASPVKRATATFIYVMAALAVVAVLVTLYRGGNVTIGPETIMVSGGTNAATTAGDEVPADELEANQSEIEDRRDAIERDLVASPEAAIPTVTVNGNAFAGTFVSGPFVYEIDQLGGVASIVETSNGFTTAVGNGTITGNQFDFVFEDSFGGVGFGTLVLDQSGNTLSGQFNGAVTVPVAIQRIG